MKIKTALISVFDKSGLKEFAAGLAEFGIEIISTGKTAKMLAEAGLKVQEISDYTGFPEMMEGRLKTLHPRVHGGLLARRDKPEHLAQAEAHGIRMIDLLVVNLYPFEATIAKAGVGLDEVIENIDIGGPGMLRAASKNYAAVAVVCNPDRYGAILEEMRSHDGELSLETRARLAVEAYSRTAAYDTTISTYLNKRLLGEAGMPSRILLSYDKVQDLRYGENPHQEAAFYRSAGVEPKGLAAARQLQGKELSYNNYLDLDTVLGFISEFDEPAAIIVKHNSPCGAAVADTLTQAYQDALATDPISSFGGIIALSRAMDLATAQAIFQGMEKHGFMECILAPGYAPEALKLFESKRNLRLLELPDLKTKEKLWLRPVAGGLLTQVPDYDGPEEMKAVSQRPPTAEELTALGFAWTVSKHTKSNAIVVAKGKKAVGIGGGDTSRVDAARSALRRAGERAKGAVLASDAFFPFADTVDLAIEAGVTAIIQPGGSLNDAEVIKTCDAHNLALVFTGVRHFRH
jgi:phosphoribosylaminoimidazolecarboxamide formyltransferase / IMP cyclohydrolase